VSDPKARAAALQASIKARLDALKARTTTTTMFPPMPPPSTMTALSVSAAKTTNTTIITTTGEESRKRTRTHNEEYAEGSSIINDESGDNNKTKKRAKVFELDMSTTTSERILEKQLREEKLRALAAAASREKVNPYLAHNVTASASSSSTKAKFTSSLLVEAGGDSTTSPLPGLIIDDRLANKPERIRSRPLNFIVPGTYMALGEKKRQLAANAEESGFISGRKTGNVFKSVGMGGLMVDDNDDDAPSSADIYGASMAGKIIDSGLPGRFDAPEIEPDERIAINEGNDVSIMLALNVATSSMPYAMEWWDAELLPGKLRKELAGEEGKAIASRAKKKRILLGKAAKVVDGDDNGQTTLDTSNVDGYRSRIDKHDELIAKCYKQASLTHSKTHALLQHPIPVLTPAQQAAVEAKKNRPPTLHLTKAEQKRHRKLRRAERLREQQDMQAAGLVPPPEPRLTLANYMKVLGDQAILDPSRMEAAVVSQIQGRKLKHDQMNAERKLTKEQKAAKHARKLEEDTTQSINVALFYVKDMGHPYHRTKVDLNAQQNGISGGVLECDAMGMALVIAEGGERAIKRYIRLMTVRMRWKGEDFYEDEDDDVEEEELMVGDDEDDNVKGVNEDGNTTTTSEKKRKKFNPDNECDIIWSGMAIKRAFHSFMFQNAESSVVARKILEAKGVAHYWDLAIGHVERKGGTGGLGLRFGDFVSS
jgi:U4/U6 small nuclear ribonucleoprotein PRP3